MHPLRPARILVRFMLAWFVLSLAAAMASPIVKPQGMALVCAASGGLKLIVQDDDSSVRASHTLDCPLCATASAPPGMLQCAPVAPESQGGWPALVRMTPPAQGAAPPPSRGPPGHT